MMIWYDHDWGWSWWAWALMWLGMLAFWALVIWGITVAVLSSGRWVESPPERMLADRYARGEINEEEYQRRLDVIRSRVSSEHQRPR